ncbi:hypothetical protein Ari01nite_61780 [Paractinoplanes rishiriensis]|uniref:Lipoprotein n=2 Tax=Paractinoplanes rishiriensis TaxID=1050105 RepID=A0A919K1U0_9ACTN|nr:hypothetical protein Ari01nite_61780 [Actinoplanes rishiriensis]
MVKRVLVTAAVVIGALGAAAGCSGPAPQSSSRASAEAEIPVVTASPTVSNLNKALLPLDQYVATADQMSDLQYASALLASDCMKRYGIAWDPGERPVLAWFRDRTNRLGFVDEVNAAKFGYHPDPATAGDGQNPDKKRGVQLTDEQARVLQGDGDGQKSNGDIPEGGCFGEGRRKIGWDPGDTMWVQMIWNDATQRSLADKRATELNARWSSCMAESGYRYDKFEDAQDDRRWWKQDDAPASRAEINTAVADVRCKKKINYVGALTAVLVAYQQQAVDKNAERLASVRGKTDEALKKAAAVLGGR